MTTKSSFFSINTCKPIDNICILYTLPGLFLVIFLTEPVGLSPPNFTEPDGKTASLTKEITIFINLLIVGAYIITQAYKNDFFCISVNRNTRVLRNKPLYVNFLLPSTLDAFT